MKYLLSFIASLGLALIPSITLAHEAYVIPTETFWNVMSQPFSRPSFDALSNGENFHITLIIVSTVIIGLFLNFLFRRSDIGEQFHSFFERFAHYGPLFVRFAFAVALFFSAYSNTFLGPEIPLDLFPFAILARMLLFLASVMIAFGFLTELAALFVLGIFILATIILGPYMVSYANYFGELLVLLLFGMRVFSLDTYIFGKLKHLTSFEKYETLIVRGFYGLALIYAAITVKLLHPDLTLYVVNNYNLTQFHWLFPSDPLLVALGAGIVEIVIGLFIIIGFEMRLTVLVSLFYITLSLIFFGEQVWPHLILYGISLNLLVQPERFTIDHILFKHHRKEHSWWKRVFHAHTHKGKSLRSNASKI